MLVHESNCQVRNGKYYPDKSPHELVCDCRRKDKDPLPQVRYCSFSCYTNDDRWPESLTLEQIVNLSLETGDLWARLEDSGCESSYVEVARWSHDRERWERFAFEKMLDVWFIGDDGEPLELSDDEKAERLVELINTATDFGFIHHLPAWEGVKPAVTA